MNRLVGRNRRKIGMPCIVRQLHGGDDDGALYLCEAALLYLVSVWRGEQRQHIEAEGFFDVVLGGYTGVHQFCKIGAHAFVAGGAILTRDLPPYVMIAGNPAKPNSINSEGLKRRGYTPGQIRNLRLAYRILYRSDLKLVDAVARLTELARDNAEVQPLLAFIAASTRSLVR